MVDPLNISSLERADEPRGSLNILRGGNFSGRTDYLKKITGVEPPDEHVSRSAVYLGPEPETALSGIALSVRQELLLHHSDVEAVLGQILPLLALEPLYGRVPFTLSGGETAKLGLACALLLRPNTLAVDCTFEQVDSATRREIMRRLRLDNSGRVCIADNRINELGLDADFAVPPSASEPITKRMDPTGYPVTKPSPVSLNFDSIAFRYHRELPSILKNINVTLQPGRVHYLEGLNGSGKSTLAKILCGTVCPQRGSLTANQKPYRPWSEGNGLVSYHFQNPDRGRLRQTLRAELAASVRFLTGDESQSARERCAQVTDALGLSDLLDRPVDLLPYTVRKRIALAAALAPSVPWLFLDEPTLGQDDAAVSAIAQILQAEAASGRGVVVVSHATALRSQLPGPRLLLRNGEIEMAGA